MKSFHKWPTASLGRPDKFKQSLNWPVAASAQEAFEAAACVARKLGRRAFHSPAIEPLTNDLKQILHQRNQPENGNTKAIAVSSLAA